MTDTPELARQLGEVQGSLSALQREMTAHRSESRDNNTLMHQRISDGQKALLAKIAENALAIRAIEADLMGDRAVSKFKRTVGYVLLTLSGGAGAEIIRNMKDWFGSGG